MNSILIVQYGDYREAYSRLAESGTETYRDQKRSVDYVANLAAQARVTTVCLSTETYRAEIAPGLWSFGLTQGADTAQMVADIFETTDPTRVILRTPHLAFLRGARQRKIPVLPNFADILSPGGPRTKWRNYLLRRELLKCRAPCYSNHSLNASRSFVDVLGLPAQRVVPWDWSKIPVNKEPKTGIKNPQKPSAFFAGMISEEKGVGDCLDAIAMLKQQGIALNMRFAGGGALDQWRTRVQELGISDQATFLGMISNTQVRTEMHQHDLVIVPSRPAYDEGLPNTIYEALASRSVLLLSDHPAFAGRLAADQEALFFKANDPASLAQSVARVVADAPLYARLSAQSPAAHDSLYVGMEWTKLVDAFLEDPDDQTGWVEQNSLTHL